MTVSLNPKYKALYSTDKRYIILTGGRGSGKTFVVQDFLARLMEDVGEGILYTRYTMKSVKDTIIPLFLAYLNSVGNPNDYTTTATKIINKRTGSFILFSGIKVQSKDQTGNLKSLPNITCWVIEEGEDFANEKSFTDIDDSIRVKGKQNRVIWIQNPSTRQHFIFKKFFQDNHIRVPVTNNKKYSYTDNDGNKQLITYQKCTHPDVDHIHTTYLDNVDNLDANKVKQWERVLTKNPKLWANKYGGAWVDMAEGAIFEHVNWISKFPENIKRVSWGMDFGFSDSPTTLVKCGISDGELFAERWLYKTGMVTKDIHNAFIQLGIKKTQRIYADSADPKTIKELKNLGWDVKGAKKGPDSRRNGINKIKGYEGLSIVDCKYWKIEQYLYIWKKNSRNDKLTEEPVKEFDHLWDALRYGIQGLTRRQAQTRIS